MSAGKETEEDKGLWHLQHTHAKKVQMLQQTDSSQAVLTGTL